MVELCEWSIIVTVPAQVPKELAAAVSEAVSAEVRRWTAEAQERLRRALDVPLKLVAAD